MNLPKIVTSAILRLTNIIGGFMTLCSAAFLIIGMLPEGGAAA